jgi:exodeoxyribonuclease III
MIISSWNVNGLRAVARKGVLKEWIAKQNADVLCMQETKANAEQLSFLDDEYPEYEKEYHTGEKAGYAGVSTWTRGIATRTYRGLDAGDPEGRVLRTDFDEWSLLNIYFPNGGKSSEAWEYKLVFYDHILALMNDLRAAGRHVIMVGDLNVAHREIDIARPKENEGKIGFHPKERAWVDRMLEAGWADVFRSKHPDTVAYSYWHLISRARERNVGWRIDAFYLNEQDLQSVKRIRYDTEQMGSDHCPVTIELV